MKTCDLLIAALAVQHDAGVLHYDSDYDLISQGGGETFQCEWPAERGSLETAAEGATNARKTFSKSLGRRMVQLQGDADLEVWPKLIDWMDDELRDRELEVPPPADLP